MDSTQSSTTATVTSHDSNHAMNASTSTFDIKRKWKSNKKGKSLASNSVYSPPDLDIVSGFAFLSFSNLQDLERHIEQHEVKTQSLSISVGQKRKQQPKSEKNIDKIASDNVPIRGSKRIKIPSQKILESYATNDIPIRQLITSSDSQSRQHVKLSKSPCEDATNSDLQVNAMHLNVKKEFRKKACCSSFSKGFQESRDSDISLECAESIEVCIFDDEDAREQMLKSNSQVTEVTEKKHKKKKRKKEINDQTCQTMFRIKKKKTSTDSTPHSAEVCVPSNSDCTPSRTLQNCSEAQHPDLDKKGKISSLLEVKEEKVFNSTEQYQQMQATKYFDSKYPRPIFSNKVEKINYCARSGGVSLVKRHHQRQGVFKDIDTASDKDSAHNNSDASIQCESYLSDHSSSSSTTNSSIQDQDGLPSNKHRIFAGSMSVFINSVEEVSEDVDIDSECDVSLPINIVKGLPKNYLFGHYSTYPDKTTNGTIDVSIQIYENDIQLYMNYAADFVGKIIKIITPDDEESSKNPSGCLPHSSSYSGVPKFLQPQEYVKAVRSATERNRRHNLGDLFTHLKSEIFDDVDEFHFSKQAILTKALEVLNAEVKQSVDIIKEKAQLTKRNKELRKTLNSLLFGEDCSLHSKQLDLDKVNNYLKTMNIEIGTPGTQSERNAIEERADSSEIQLGKNVTKKGRPPLEGKFTLRTRQVISPLSHPDSKVKIKGFISIAPTTTEIKEIPIKKEAGVLVANKNERAIVCNPDSTEDIEMASVSKIVCNISRYRLQQTGESKGMTLVTNPEPVKGIDSNDVVHIKILNDTLKQVGSDDVAKNDSKKTLPQNKSLSTQTDVQLVDNNANTLKHGPGVISPSTLSPSVNATVSSQSKSLLPKQSIIKVKEDVKAQKTNDQVAASSQSKQLLPKPPTTATTSSNSNQLGSSQNVYLLPKLPAISSTPSNVCPPGSFQNVLFLPKPSTTVAVSNVPMLKPSVLMPQPSTSAGDTIENIINPVAGPVLLTNPAANSVSTSQNAQLQPIPYGDVATTVNVKSSASPVVTGSLQKPATATASTIKFKPTALKKLVDILKGRTLMSTVTTTTVTSPPDVSSNQCVTTKPVITSPECASKANVAPPTLQHTVVTSTQSIISQVTNIMPTCGQSSKSTPTECKPMTHLQEGMPSSIPVTMTSATVLPMVKQVATTTQLDQRYVTVLPSATPSSQPVTILPSSSASSSSALKIIFQPAGTPIRTPALHQSSKLVRLPIVHTANPNVKMSIPMQKGSTVTPTTNLQQEPNVKFLLQNKAQVLRQPKDNVVIQHAHSGQPRPQAQPQQLVEIRQPVVRIRPLQPPFTNTLMIDHLNPSSVLTASMQPSQGNAGVAAASSLVSPKQPTGTYTSQLVSKCGSMHIGDARNQHLFTQAPLKKSTILPAAQSGMRAGPFATASFQNSHPTNTLTTTQKPGAISASPLAPKKTVFTEMEKMVAKISSPQLPLPGNSISNTAPSCSQGLSLPSLTDNTCTSTIASPTALQIASSSTSVRPSVQPSETSLPSLGYLLAAGRATTQSNIPSTSTQTTTTHSSACVSGTTSFQVPDPKQHDKTCSVVESPKDNSHVVTAAALSVCNIDSSIPDITSELQGNSQSSLETDRLFGSDTQQKLKDPCGSAKQDSNSFSLQDESTTEDFELLASLDNVQQCF